MGRKVLKVLQVLFNVSFETSSNMNATKLQETKFSKNSDKIMS